VYGESRMHSSEVQVHFNKKYIDYKLNNKNNNLKRRKMCSEFILALVYFITIFVVNFFLYKLLRSYLKNIFYLVKIKNIFKFYKKSNINIVSLFYLFFKKEKQNSTYLLNLNKFSQTKDVIVIGNTYNYLSNNYKDDNNFYFFQLLKNQYLSSNINKNGTKI
jgi:hypothetical protein